LFLDEIGDLAFGLQSKLLRFLEQGEIQRLGSNDTFRVDVRVIRGNKCSTARFSPAKKLFEKICIIGLSVFSSRFTHLLRDRMEESEIY